MTNTGHNHEQNIMLFFRLKYLFYPCCPIDFIRKKLLKIYVRTFELYIEKNCRANRPTKNVCSNNFFSDINLLKYENSCKSILLDYVEVIVCQYMSHFPYLTRLSLMM